MGPQVSSRQLEALERAISLPRWYVDEQLWSYLTASLIAEAPDRYIQLFCGDSPVMPPGGLVACEAEPLSTRSGSFEGNTVLDIAFGHIGVRATAVPGKTTLAGISYTPKSADSWVCFVEAKYLSDCSSKVTNDPLRNQLTRVIENLLCFQVHGEFPARLYFTLLTPRVFKQAPTSRLYGYKMADYRHKEAIRADVDRCTMAARAHDGYCWPDVAKRLEALATPQWVTFEDVLEVAGFGSQLDVVARHAELGPVHAEIQRRLQTQREQLQSRATEPAV